MFGEQLVVVKPLFRLLLFIAFIGIPVAVDAGSTRPIEISPGCDPEFYDVMHARSWLEGQREVEVASRLILKPDSVLEYSCFDDRVNELGAGANLMFSDNVSAPGPLFTNHPTGAPRPDFPGPPDVAQPDIPIGDPGPNPPGTPPILLSSQLDNSLNEAVRTPYFGYAGVNFGHVYGGGTYAGIPPPASSCNAMNAVWLFLKCQDFPINQFRTLLELSVVDPRDMPLPCNDPNRGTNWANNLADAFPNPGTPGAADLYDAYLPKVNANSAGGCSEDPILTGLQVYAGGSSEDDAVCPTPGCYYDGTSSCQ